MKHTRLRTKTGCFTCNFSLCLPSTKTYPNRRAGRRRRVKCGEERPRCQNCSNTGHDCDWPTSHDLCDRRNLPKAGQKCPPSSTSGKAISPTCNAKHGGPRVTVNFDESLGLRLCFNKSLGRTGIECEDDVELIYHFLNNFLSVLVLPTWNRQHLEEYQSELMGMMMHSKGVKCAVLAACAANKYHFQQQSLRETRPCLLFPGRVACESGITRLRSAKRSPLRLACKNGDLLVST